MSASHPSGHRRRLGSAHVGPLVILIAATLAIVPFASGAGDGPDLSGLPPANEGAFEGGSTGTHEDPGEDATLPNQGANIPTGGLVSPLFGAQPFTQRMLRFEEFGPVDMPAVYIAQSTTFPAPEDAHSVPDPVALDQFLGSPLFPEPSRLANDIDANPWQSEIEAFLGRGLNTPPAEGRPAGEDYAHQRWSEFEPDEFYVTAQAGARTNLGMRDPMQLHSYSAGEFGPGGLYHNTVGAPGFEGTTAGIEIKFHPNMPIQDPSALWTFDGTLPPKVLAARYGTTILMRHYNALPISPSANMGFGLHTITTHEHNGHTPAESDGYANAFFFPGQYYDYRWPMVIAGHDSVNTGANDLRAGAPDGNGGIKKVQGDWRETMSTHWFHDHMLDFTAQNVYKGNAAMMNYYSSLDRGNEGLDDGINMRFPSGTALDWANRDYDVNLLVADKAWDQSGQLWFNIFNLDGFIGDRLLTNWLWMPTMQVRARQYRFRILNGSVSRYLKIALVTDSGAPVTFHMIANDGNIMEHTVAFDGTLGTQKGILPTQGIAERYDIIVDFSQFAPGEKLYFVNTLEHDDGKAPKNQISLSDIQSGAYEITQTNGEWDKGDPCVTRFLEFEVMPYSGVDLSMDPSEFVAGGKTLIPVHRPTSTELASATKRHFEFGRSSGTDNAPWTVKSDGGSGLNMDPRRLSAVANNGDYMDSTGQGHLQVWTIENGGGGWSHPIHIHFEEGVILQRDGLPPPEWERWARKDVYRIGTMPDSGDSVTVALRFREFAGTYMEHCHNTQHEDHAMLLRWDIENPGQTIMMPTPIPTWDGVSYVASVALPTAFTGVGGDAVHLGSNENGGGDPPPPDPVAETIRINRAKYGRAFGHWRILGFTDDATPGNMITVHRGPDLTGPILGQVLVKRSGKWKLAIRDSLFDLGPTETISAVSLSGASHQAFKVK
jgi:FtsP/CotA-like multicopper oxidase with cupredoxin domain